MSKRGAACLVVTVLLLGAVVWRAGAGRFAAAFAQPNYLVVAAAFAFTPVVILLKAFRWHLLVRSQIADAAFVASLKSYLTGLLLAVLTPLSAGEVARGVYTSATRRVELTGLVLVDKLFDLTAVCVCGCAGLMLLDWAAWGAAGLALIAVAWVVGMACVGWLSRSRWSTRYALVGRVSSAMSALRGRLVAMCLSIAVVNFAVYYTQVYVVFRSFGEAMPLAATAAFPVITLSTIIPFAIGGLGIRELAAQVLLSRFGIGDDVAASAYLIHFALIMIAPALVGGLWLGDVPRAESTSDPAS